MVAAGRSVGALVALATVLGLTPGAPAPSGPRAGDPCGAQRSYPVTFPADADGGMTAAFDFAGGAARGSLPLSTGDAQLAETHTASVTDVQLGTYEASRPHAAPVCRVVPTVHFFCPATGALDQLCYTWAVRRARAT